MEIPGNALISITTAISYQVKPKEKMEMIHKHVNIVHKDINGLCIGLCDYIAIKRFIDY